MKIIIFFTLILINNIAFASDREYHITCTHENGDVSFDKNVVDIFYSEDNHLNVVYLDGTTENLEKYGSCNFEPLY